MCFFRLFVGSVKTFPRSIFFLLINNSASTSLINQSRDCSVNHGKVSITRRVVRQNVNPFLIAKQPLANEVQIPLSPRVKYVRSKTLPSVAENRLRFNEC